VAGPPAGAFKWPGFFSVCAYEAFGDIFTLAELEHCIVKAGACSAVQFVYTCRANTYVANIYIFSSSLPLLYFFSTSLLYLFFTSVV
jgi:hypothetical protein